MRVVVGTENEPKCLAVVKAFELVFESTPIIEKVAAESGVTDHPLSGEESIAGALNRINFARDKIGDADYYVGIEGGLISAGEHSWELGFIAVQNADGKTHTSVSSGPEMKGKILQDLKDGLELSDIIQEQYGIERIGSANGFYGLITNDIVTREKAYVEALVFALAPFKNSQYFE